MRLILHKWHEIATLESMNEEWMIWITPIHINLVREKFGESVVRILYEKQECDVMNPETNRYWLQ